MSRTIIILALTSLLASCVAFWGWSEASLARGQVKDQIELREAAEARLGKVQTQLRIVKSNHATTSLRLDQALRGRTPNSTPVAVRNVLCERGNCATVDTMQTPAD